MFAERRSKFLVLGLITLCIWGLWAEFVAVTGRESLEQQEGASESENERASTFLLRLRERVSAQAHLKDASSTITGKGDDGLTVAEGPGQLLTNISSHDKLVIAYCTYKQEDRRFDPLGHSDFFSHFFGAHVYPGRQVEFRPCVAIPKHLPADVVPASPEGLRLLGLSADVHIRVCSFGATEMVKTLTAVPGVALSEVNVADAQARLKERTMWWTDNPPGVITEKDEYWSHSGRIFWPRGGVIRVPINITTKRPFGPFFARHNKEPWFESVGGVTSQFDTKRVKLSVDSITLYHPMVLDSMSWRLTADRYPNHWSARVGKPRLPASTIKEALTRPEGYNAKAVREAKKFFTVAVNSHCAGPGAYLRSVTIRELFAFSIVKAMNKSVHMPGSCPVTERWRAGPKDPELSKYKGGSAVDIMSLHQFSITFENSATSGYFTEKIVNAYLAESIPIYFGPPRAQVEHMFNTKAFVHCDLPQDLTSEGHLKDIIKKQCVDLAESSDACYKKYEVELEKQLEPYYAICVKQVQELERDPTKYEEMLSQPLVRLDDQGELTGMWDARELGKVVRVAMTAFGYAD